MVVHEDKTGNKNLTDVRVLLLAKNIGHRCYVNSAESKSPYFAINAYNYVYHRYPSVARGISRTVETMRENRLRRFGRVHNDEVVKKIDEIKVEGIGGGGVGQKNNLMEVMRACERYC